MSKRTCPNGHIYDDRTCGDVCPLCGEPEKAYLHNGPLNSPETILPLAHKMISIHAGGLFFETPETNGFPANRYVGRLNGYMYALACDRVRSKEMLSVNIETISSYAYKDELNALGLLQHKIEEQTEKEIPPFDDGKVGLLEGMAIYINKEDLSLLYSEIDIDLNKNCDDDGIPSYAYQREHLKAGLQLSQCDKSKEDVVRILMSDGLAEKGATKIVDTMVKVVKKQRKKSALKTFAVGCSILVAGLIITGVTYQEAANNGGGRFLLAWGAMGGGTFYALSGLVGYIKALNYNG